MTEFHPYDYLPSWLIDLLLDRRRLSNTAIDQLIYRFGTIEPHIDEGLAACTIYDYAREIATNQNYAERRKKASHFLNWLDKGLKRAFVHGELMDYTRYRKGQKSLMGNRIDYCPVCGRKGAIEPVYRKDGNVVHWGHTIHKTRPFFMGEESIERCEWSPE